MPEAPGRVEPATRRRSAGTEAASPGSRRARAAAGQRASLLAPGGIVTELDLDQAQRRARLVAAALGGRADVAERLLEHDPALAASGLDVALVLGDAPAVAAALERDPALVDRELPGPGAGRSRVPATPCSCARPRRGRRACGASWRCSSTAAPIPTRSTTTSTGRCPRSTARRGSPTTWRPRGCCSTAAPIPTTASPSTTRSRPTTPPAWSCSWPAARPCATRTRSATRSRIRSRSGSCSSRATCARRTRSCATPSCTPASPPSPSC